MTNKKKSNGRIQELTSDILDLLNSYRVGRNIEAYQSLGALQHAILSVLRHYNSVELNDNTLDAIQAQILALNAEIKRG